MRNILAVVVMLVGLVHSLGSSNSASSGQEDSFNEAISAPVPQLWQSIPTGGNLFEISPVTYTSAINASTGITVFGSKSGTVTVFWMDFANPSAVPTLQGVLNVSQITQSPGGVVYVGAGGTGSQTFVAVTRTLFAIVAYDLRSVVASWTLSASDKTLAVVDAISNLDAVLVISEQQIRFYDRARGPVNTAVNVSFAGLHVAATCGSDDRCWVVASNGVVVCLVASTGKEIDRKTLHFAGPASAPVIAAFSGGAIVGLGNTTGLLRLDAKQINVKTTTDYPTAVTAVAGGSVSPSGDNVAAAATGSLLCGYYWSAESSGSSCGGINSNFTVTELRIVNSEGIVAALGINYIAVFNISSTGVATRPLWTSQTLSGYIAPFFRASFVAVPSSMRASSGLAILTETAIASIYVANLIDVPTGRALAAINFENNMAQLLTTYTAAGHVVGVLGLTNSRGSSITYLAGVDMSAPPSFALNPLGTTSVPSTYIDGDGNAYYFIAQTPTTAGQPTAGTILKCQRGATTMTTLAVLAIPRLGEGGQWLDNFVKMLYHEPTQSLVLHGSVRTTQGFGVRQFSAIVNAATGAVRNMTTYINDDFNFAFVDPVNQKLVVVTSVFSTVDLLSGASTTFDSLSWLSGSQGFKFIEQVGNRALVYSFNSRGGYIVIDVRTGSLLLSTSTFGGMALTPDGGVVGCLSAEGGVVWYDANMTTTAFAMGVGCVGTPLVADSETVYIPVSRWSNAAGQYQMYVARVNFTNSSTTAAIALWSQAFSSSNMKWLYSRENQLLIAFDKTQNAAMCLDLVGGSVLWSNLAPTSRVVADFSHNAISAPTGAASGNVVWGAPSPTPNNGYQAVNLFTGEVLEAVLISPLSVGVAQSAAGPVVVAVTSVAVAFYDNLVVQAVQPPKNFRSSALPLFAPVGVNLLPPQTVGPYVPIPTFPPVATSGSGDDSHTTIFLGLGLAGAALSGLGLLIRRVARRRSAPNNGAYTAVPAMVQGIEIQPQVRTTEDAAKLVV